MAVTFPVTFPTTFGVSNFQIGLDHAVGVTESPFTFEQQVQEHQGTSWEISATLQLLNRDQAEEYNAFIASLRGRTGTFLMTIPGSETPRGVATGTPLVDGGAQTGTDLVTDGWTPSQTGILKAGDFINLGSGSSTRLHRVLEDVDSDGGGSATLVLAPKIVSDDSPGDNDPITVTNCKGLFRLKSNLISVDIQPPNQHTIRFSAREAK